MGFAVWVLNVIYIFFYIIDIGEHLTKCLGCEIITAFEFFVKSVVLRD